MASSLTMAPLNDAQLAEQLVKVQEQLDQLEKLVRQQNANPHGNFEDLVNQGTLKLSKKEKQARNAGDKAKSAIRHNEIAQRSQLDAKSNLIEIVTSRVNDEVVSTARRDYWKAKEESDAAQKDATEEVVRAVKKLEIVINFRLTSDSRQGQALQAQEAAEQQARQAQEAALSQTDTQQAILDRNVLAKGVNLQCEKYTTLDTQKQIDLEVINGFDANLQLRRQEEAEERYNELYDVDEAEEQAEMAERAQKARIAIERTEEAERQTQNAANQARRDFLQRLWDEPSARHVNPRDDSNMWNEMLHFFVRMEDQWPQGVQQHSSSSHNQLRSWEDLITADISLAIASLSVGIAQAGGPTVIIATDEMQQYARVQKPPFVCLSDPNIFIMSILIDGGMPDVGEEGEDDTDDWELADEDAQAIWEQKVAREEAEKANVDASVKHKGKDEPWYHAVGHSILVVAERIDDNVHFKISNSMDGNPRNRRIVTRIIRNIVRYSGWMDGRRPQFAREWQLKVSPQMWGFNACGIHVILNGWAYLLRVKVNECWQPSEALYEDARRLINSALRGNIAAGHIEAWMFAKGFAKPQPFNERIKAVNDNGMAHVMTARTARMNHDIYDEYIAQARAQEIAIAAASVTAPPAPPVQPPRPAAPRKS